MKESQLAFPKGIERESFGSSQTGQGTDFQA